MVVGALETLEINIRSVVDKCMYIGLDIVTNDYQFLFRFALETDALIEANDFDSDSICNNFTLRYGG